MDKDELIELVYSVPAIWNKLHRQHHNRFVLTREWRKLAQKMQVTENDARQCWKNLRQEYGKQLKKVKGRSGDGADDDHDTYWPYFHKLFFLRDQFTPRRMSSNLIDTPDENLTQDSLNINPEISDESEGDHSAVSSIPNIACPHAESQAGQTDAIASSTRSTSRSTSEYAVTQTGYKKRITAQVEIGKQLVDLEKEKLALKEKSLLNKIRQKDNDEDIGFFNSLLPHVRKLTPRDKLKFRMKVQETLFELLFPSDSEPLVEQIERPSFDIPSSHSHLSPNFCQDQYYTTL